MVTRIVLPRAIGGDGDALALLVDGNAFYDAREGRACGDGCTSLGLIEGFERGLVGGLAGGRGSGAGESRLGGRIEPLLVVLCTGDSGCGLWTASWWGFAFAAVPGSGGVARRGGRIELRGGGIVIGV